MSGGFDSAGFDVAGFDTGDITATQPYPGPAGAISGGKGISGPAGRKRKKYIFDGQELSLNREELEEALESMLVKAEPAADGADSPAPTKVKPQDRAIVAAFPAYPDLRDLLLAARQIEAAQVLRQVAQRLADEQDERDVEELILWE